MCNHGQFGCANEAVIDETDFCALGSNYTRIMFWCVSLEWPEASGDRAKVHSTKSQIAGSDPRSKGELLVYRSIAYL